MFLKKTQRNKHKFEKTKIFNIFNVGEKINGSSNSTRMDWVSFIFRDMCCIGFLLHLLETQFMGINSLGVWSHV